MAKPLADSTLPRRRSATTGPTGVGRWPAWLTLAGLAYASLLPFDLHLPAGWHGLWPLLADLLTRPAWQPGPPDDLLLNSLLYMPVGLLLGWHALRESSRPRCALAGGLVITAFVVWLLESLQGLIPTRCASLTDWTLNMAGLLAGVALARFLNGRAGRWMWRWTGRLADRLWAWRRYLPGRAGSALVGLALVGQLLWMWRSAMPDPRHMVSPSLERVNLVPLLLQFRMAYGHAMMALAGQMAGFLLLAMLLSLVIRRLRPGLPSWVVVPLTGAIALSAELMKWLDRTRWPDVTDPLLACLAAVGVMVVLESLARRPRTTPVGHPAR